MSISVLKPRPRLSVLENDECPEDEIAFELPKQDIGRHIGHVSSYSVERDLLNIARQFKECVDSKEDYLDGFKGWEPYRKKNIDHLGEIVAKLDEVHFNTNIAKTAASVGGIISGFIGIVGATTMWSSGTDTSSLQLTADFGNLVSSAVSTGAAATEIGLSKMYIDNVKRMLRNDCERFEPIQNWFERSRDLKNAIDVLCHCNIMSDVFQKLMVVVPLVISTYGSLASQVEETVKQVTNMLHKNISRNDVKKIIFLCASICRNPQLLKIIENVHQMIRNSPFIMPVVATLVKLPSELQTISRCIHGPSGKSSTSTEESRRKAITYGIFQGVNVAIEFFSLSLLVEDFKKGSRSELSAALKEIKEHLEMELNQVSRVRRNLLQK